MNYTNMLCWVRPHEKKELIAAVNGRFPVTFAKNYDDFKSKITDDRYLVMSLSKAKFGIKKLQQLVRSFPSNIFNLYALGEEVMESNQFIIMEEPNVTNGQYPAEMLVANYLGEIPDLWELRQSAEAAISF